MKLYFQSHVYSDMMKCHKFHPYKTHFAKELCGETTDCQIKFCEWFNRQRIWVDRVIFSNKVCFHLKGHVNWHNTVNYRQDNPHVKVMLITNLTQEKPRCARYMETFQGSWMPPVVDWCIGTVHGWNTTHSMTSFYCQQDGTPHHFAGKVQNCVKFFPGDALGRGDINWP